MAKDTSRVYAEMKTKELVKLRAQHMVDIAKLEASRNWRVAKMSKGKRKLVQQIEHELAVRVANFNLFD